MEMTAPNVPQVPLLDLDLLSTIIAIVETGSFSAAGSRVFRTPSAISMQVKKIEEILGRPVFLRDSRSVRLTEDGEFLLEHARRMIALNREAVARFVSPDLTGVVRFGATDDVGSRIIPDMLCRFAQTHAGVTVNVVIDSSANMMKMFDEGRIDLGIISCEGCIADTRAEILFTEDLVWGMCAGGVAAEARPLPVSVWDKDCAWRRAAEGALEEAGIEWRVAFQSAHITGQRAAILADLAVAPIPRSSIGADIVEVPERIGLPKLPQTALGFLVPDDPDPHVAAAADHLRAAFAAAPFN